MSQYPKLHEHPEGLGQWILLNFVFFGLFIGFFGPITSTLALVCAYRVRPLWKLVGVAPLSLGWLPVVAWGIPSVSSWGGLAVVWTLTLPLVPVAALLLKGMVMFSYFLKPKTLSEQVDAKTRAQVAQGESLARRARRVADIGPVPQHLRLGTFIRRDRFPAYMGVKFDRRWLLLEEDLLDQHMFILGATGAGKTQAIRRLVHEALVATDRHIYIVDGKGEEAFAQGLRNQIHQHTGQLAPIFRLGADRFGAVYNGFCGDPRALYSRLLALLHVEEAEGNAQYYADINRDLLQLVCYAPGGPPRNFEEVQERLNKEWLTRAYRGNVREVQAIEDIQPKSFHELAPRLRSLLREFAPCIGEQGFALDTTPYAIFSLRTQSVGDTARRFLDFLIEDLKDFVGKRQRHPGLLIIDEFGQFDNESIVDLLTLARAYHMGVVLATQDLSTLRDPVVSKQVLANARTKILMASDFPEDVATLAGTILRAESSFQHEEGNATGMGSVRIQDSFKIDMNEAAGLPAGESFLIRQRRTAKFYVRPVPNGSADAPPQDEELRQWQTPRSTHPTQKKRKSPADPAAPRKREPRL